MTKHINKMKMFTADNYEKEEAYLREMSLKGWHFKHLHSFSYLFEEGEPKAYCYRLDLIRDAKADREYHIKMYEDCGWTHVFEFPVPYMPNSRWEYFRIESQTGAEEELFTDNESKIAMLTRVRGVYTMMFILAVAFNAIPFMNLYERITRFDIVPQMLFWAAYALIFWLYGKMLIRLTMKIGKLRKGNGG